MVQQVILSLFAYPHPRMLTVGKMKDKFDETGELIDEDYRDRFEGFVDTFVAFTTKLSEAQNKG